MLLPKTTKTKTMRMAANRPCALHQLTTAGVHVANYNCPHVYALRGGSHPRPTHGQVSALHEHGEVHLRPGTGQRPVTVQ